MTKILLPVDGSEVSARVADVLPLRLQAYTGPVELHVLNVQHPVHQDVGQFVAHTDLQDFHRKEGLAALAGVRAALEVAGLPAQAHVLIHDHPADAIVQFAAEHGFDEIMMTTHGRGALTKLFLGSVTAEVIRLADVPVVIVK